MVNSIYDADYVRTQHVSIPEGLNPLYLVRFLTRKLSDRPWIIGCEIDPQYNLDYRVIRGRSNERETVLELLLHIKPVLTSEQAKRLRAGELGFSSPLNEFDLNLTQAGTEAINPELIERVRAEFEGPRRFFNLALYRAEDYAGKVRRTIRPF